MYISHVQNRLSLKVLSREFILGYCRIEAWVSYLVISFSDVSLLYGNFHTCTRISCMVNFLWRSVCIVRSICTCDVFSCKVILILRREILVWPFSY